jgi:uncharacterized protein YjbJ (UPF0337 family)
MPEHEEKNLGAQGMADKVKGKAKEYTGKAQKQMGKATGSREQQIKGKAREVEGGAQARAGDVEGKGERPESLTRKGKTEVRKERPVEISTGLFARKRDQAPSIFAYLCIICADK